MLFCSVTNAEVSHKNQVVEAILIGFRNIWYCAKVI